MSTTLFQTGPRPDKDFRRIDIHHHYFPSDLKKEQSNADIGWRTPTGNLPWDPSISLRAMDAMNVDVAILSFPAISSGSICEENRATARGRNEFAASICRAHPDRFGFFATLPFLDDVEGFLLEDGIYKMLSDMHDSEGCLQEITYALDELHANGVSISSSYGEGPAGRYVGDERYQKIWAELDKRQAVVFLHGSQVSPSIPYPHPFLGIPVVEVPNETFKGAAHLVVTGHRRKFPNVKIILAHLGGTTPFLAPRVAVLSNHMGCPLSPEEILADFKTFFYDAALSAYESNLAAIEKLVQPDHILFGTDFPAVSIEMAEWFTKKIHEHYREDEEKLRGVMGDNASKLFCGLVRRES